MTQQPQPGAQVAIRDQYAILKSGGTDVAEILEMNVGGTLSEFDLDRVKVPAGGGTAWEVPTLEGVKNQEEIEGVIVHWKQPRGYWSTPFTGGNEPPSCSSQDSVLGVGDFGVGSEANPSGECAVCPMSQWGSGTNEKGEPTRGQACKQMRALFVVTPGDVLPQVVVLPPTSIKPMHRYFLRLASKAVPYFAVITKLRLQKATNNDGIRYSMVEPSLGGLLTPEDADQVEKYGDQIRESLNTFTPTAADYHAAEEAAGPVGPDTTPRAAQPPPPGGKSDKSARSEPTS